MAVRSTTETQRRFLTSPGLSVKPHNLHAKEDNPAIISLNHYIKQTILMSKETMQEVSSIN